MKDLLDRQGIKIFKLTERHGGTDAHSLTIAALSEKFRAAADWKNGAMDNASVNGFRMDYILGSEEISAVEEMTPCVCIETGQDIRAMSPLRYRRGWLRF